MAVACTRPIIFVNFNITEKPLLKRSKNPQLEKNGQFNFIGKGFASEWARMKKIFDFLGDFCDDKNKSQVFSENATNVTRVLLVRL